jgi:uncharacterized protein involved in exopolysaccharide biosynthesis
MSTPVNNGDKRSFENDMFDVSGFIRLISRSVSYYRSLVWSTCLAVVVLVTVYVVIWPPVYSVEAKLAAERDLDPARDQFYSNWQIFRKDDPRDELQLFTAGPVLREVVEKNHLTYNDVYHPFMDHLGYLWEKSWPGRKYNELKDKLLPSSDAPSQDVKGLGHTMAGLKAGIKIEPVADTHVAILTVKGPNRHVSDVANSIVDSYLAYRSQRHRAEAQKALAVLDTEADRAHADLEEVRERRDEFALKNQLMIDFEKENLDIKELTGLETGLANENSKMASLQASLRAINDAERGETPVKVLSSTRETNAVLENARQRRLELQTSLIGLRDHYREDSPEVQEVLTDLKKVDALIAQEPQQVDRSVTEGLNSVREQLISNRDQLQSELQGTRASAATMQVRADKMRSRLTQLPTMMSTAQDITREYDVAAEKYKQLLFRRMEAQVSYTALEASPSTISVIEYAEPPMSKYWPRLKYLYPGAVVGGLLLGVLAAVLRSLTAGRLLRDHIDQGRVPLPLYATIGKGGHAEVIVLPRSSHTDLLSKAS